MNGGPITNFDKARAAVELCHSVDDVVQFETVARMAEVYAKQAGDTQMERQAIDIRIRAERKCGELLGELERAKVPNPTGANQVRSTDGTQPKSAYAATLERTGISKQQASRYQQLARVPESEFEASMVGTERPSARAIIDRVTAAKPVESEHITVSERALFLWGRLRDFERMGMFEVNRRTVLAEMTENMRLDVERLLIEVRLWVEAE